MTVSRKCSRGDTLKLCLTLLFFFFQAEDGIRAWSVTGVQTCVFRLVGLFVNANPSFIDEILCEVPLDTLQFHGDESVLDCAQYQMPFIKSLRLKPDTNVKEIAENFSSASALLLDSFSPSSYGGTGESFDWSLACVKISLPIILAGGLTVDNVADAIKQVNPYVVDASSGVESAPGVKDIDKIEAFIRHTNS